MSSASLLERESERRKQLAGPVRLPPHGRGLLQSHAVKHHKQEQWASLGRNALGGSQPEVPLMLCEKLDFAPVPNATSVYSSEDYKVEQVELTGLARTLNNSSSSLRRIEVHQHSLVEELP